jgi:hypothetical protein
MLLLLTSTFSPAWGAMETIIVSFSGTVGDHELNITTCRVSAFIVTILESLNNRLPDPGCLTARSTWNVFEEEELFFTNAEIRDGFPEGMASNPVAYTAETSAISVIPGEPSLVSGRKFDEVNIVGVLV